MVYTVTVNPSIDYVLRVPALQLGHINRCSVGGVYAAGKGVNVSVVLKRLGVDSVATGFTAGFTGQALYRGVQDEGVQADFVHLRSGLTRINVKVRAGEETDFNCDGPDIGASDVELLKEKLGQVRAGDVVVFSGSVPGSLPQDIYARLIHGLSDTGAKFIVDAAGQALTDTLEYRPFLIKPNAEELGQIFSVSVSSAAQAAEYADRLRAMGAQNVLVSMGGQGAVLVDAEGGRSFAQAAQITPVDTVGSGDSMVAGFIAGYLLTSDLGYALRLGSAAGGATAAREGLADRSGIYGMLSRIGHVRAVE